MPSTEQLRQLMREAGNDPGKEVQVWKAMCDTVLYVHMPLKEKPGSLLFHQFVRPDDGRTVLPVFTDRDQATHAAGTAVRVMPMLGRHIFQFTLDATIMLDPNEIDCLLYPEEIALFLKQSPVVSATTWQATADRKLKSAKPADDVPQPIVHALKEMALSLPFVDKMYLSYFHWHRQEQKCLVIACVAAPTEDEHAVRALVAALQPHTNKFRCPIDIATLKPCDTEHPSVKNGRCIYTRSNAAST